MRMAIDITAPILRMVWPDDVAEIDLAPLQGLWREDQYLKLTNQTNRLIEFTDGVIEVLPMPTREHQKILAYLYRSLFTFIQSIGGLVLFAPLRIQVRPGKFREPDLLVLLNEHDPRNQDQFWLGADLVVEIVSPDKPERDTKEKPRDYAEAGIAEYWIVNPLDETITVLTLHGHAYHEHGIFHRGESVMSALLGGFELGVDAILNAA
jgi:Uma2 family endonuclease